MNTLQHTELEYEAIDDTYSKAKYGDFEVIMNIKTGYINATKLCAYGGKRVDNWLSNKNSKELMKEFEDTINISLETPSKILKSISGGQNTTIRGTYVHPDLVPHIASWVSSKFAFKVSKIINEWVRASHENKSRYWNDMGECLNQTRDMNKIECKESLIRNQIAIDEDGSIEVETPAGFIDVLTNYKIIEVKTEHNWKHALGQVKCYGFYYPNKEKWIYLFDCNYTNKDIINNICHVEGVCVKYIE
jgi:hypothetical protein